MVTISATRRRTLRLDASLRIQAQAVSHDMTVKEREQCRKLVAEAKQKREEDESGEYVYKVYGLPGQMKIMKYKNFEKIL